MRVLRLFTKQRPHPGVLAQTELTFQRECGIAGDDGAIAGSPRQVLLVDQPSLDRFGLQPGDLQENLLVDTDLSGFASGQVLQIGASVLLRLTIPCEPCATLERLRPGLMKRLQGQRGWLGMVVQSGTVRQGDRLTFTPARFPAIPEPTSARFQWFVAQIPPGRVVRTPDLLCGLGLARAYYRAIPALLKSAPSLLPVHRLVAADSTLLTKHLPEQAIALQAEGICLEAGKVSPEALWPTAEFYALGDSTQLPQNSL